MIDMEDGIVVVVVLLLRVGCGVLSLEWLVWIVLGGLCVFDGLVLDGLFDCVWEVWVVLKVFEDSNWWVCVLIVLRLLDLIKVVIVGFWMWCLICFWILGIVLFLLLFLLKKFFSVDFRVMLFILDMMIDLVEILL